MLEVVDMKEKILSTKINLIKRFFNDSGERYIVGINEMTNNILNVCQKNNIKINGIIDDYTDMKLYYGIKIYKMNEVQNRDSLIVSSVIDGRLITAINNLKRYGFKYILTYLDFCLYNRNEFPMPHFTENNFNDINNNINQYYWLYNILEDQESKSTLQSLVDFRYNFNIEPMDKFTFQIENQYFDDLIHFNDYETFVDCGGYDGDTTIKFINENPNYKKIYYFEPSVESFNLSLKKLSRFSNIELFNKATYCVNTKLKFQTDKGSENRLKDDGDTLVEAVSLDNIIDEMITYIKMDVEGAEFETVLGAEKLIKKFRPKLAICVYHKQEDFWRIPKKILEFNPTYKIYLRHYTEGLLETIMYFI